MGKEEKEGFFGHIGPVADPMPGWGSFPGVYPLERQWGIFGPVADPSPIYRLLDKSKIAKIMIRQIDHRINQVSDYLEILKVEKEMLKEQFEIK